MQVYHSYITLNLSNTFHPVCTVISFSGKGRRKPFPISLVEKVVILKSTECFSLLFDVFHVP